MVFTYLVTEHVGRQVEASRCARVGILVWNVLISVRAEGL